MMDDTAALVFGLRLAVTSTASCSWHSLLLYAAMVSVPTAILVPFCGGAQGNPRHNYLGGMTG